MKKYKNLQNLNTNTVLTNWANRVMTLQKTKQEWRTAIILSAIIKFITMLFSIFAAYQFVYDLVYNSLNNTAQAFVFTVLLLLSLEFLTAVFLEKTFKFIYRKRLNTAIPTAIIVLGLFIISFVSSTNGLAKRQQAKANNIAEILTVAQQQKDSVMRVFGAEKLEYKKLISTIEQNPSGWQNGKRCILLPAQLAQINQLQQKIDNLKHEQKTELARIAAMTDNKISANKKEQQKTADKYYSVMAVIMVVQLLSTALLIFFLYLIRSEEQPDQIVKENLSYIEKTIEQSAQTVMQNSIITAMNKFNDMTNVVFSKFENQEILSEKKADLKPEKKQIGFAQNKPEKNITEVTEKNNFFYTQKNAETLGRAGGLEELKTVDIDYLAKHKKLVKAIIKLNPKPMQAISNNQVRIVRENTPRNIQKSDTTIRKVFAVMTGVGIDNFDKEGNVMIVK